MRSDIYEREPIGHRGGIPLFSEPNDYIENYERIAGDHIEHMRKTGENPFMREDSWVQYEASTAALIRKYSKSGDRILDVGVGLGRLMAQFPNLERYGVDISLGYLEIASQNGIEVAYALVEDLPYQPETFDLVVCTDVLEHVLDVNLALAKMLRVLKPTGKLIVRVPYKEDLSWYADPNCPYEYCHLRTFDHPSLRLLFERVMGMRVVELRPAGYEPLAMRWRYGPMPARLNRAIQIGLGVTSKLRPDLRERLVRRLYLPIVTNVVAEPRARDKAVRVAGNGVGAAVAT